MATVQEEIDDFKKALQVLKEFKSPVKPLPQPGPGVGLPSVDANLQGGDSLRPGNESGILSIGTPGTGYQDLGTGFGPATYDLQESIRDQARAAEDEAARTGPSLAEQQEQLRNTFLQSLQPEQESLGGRLQRAGNLASGAFTLGSKAGLTFPPIAAGLAAANTVGNVYNQAVQDRQFIPNANPLATLLRAMTPQGFHRFIPGLTPGLERTVGKIPPGLGFHPTPQQIETSSTPPVSLPPKRQPVTVEDLPALPITDTSPERKADMWNQIQRFQQRPTVTPPEAGDIYDAPSYNPQSESFVDWDE